MMENQLRNGDYVPDGFGGFRRLEGNEKLLARALFKLNCRRGSFPFLPGLGSRLHRLCWDKPAGRDEAARLYAAQALAGMGLTVRSAQVKMVGPRQADVHFELEKDGEVLDLEVTV